MPAGCWADAGFGLWSGSIEIWDKEVRDGAGWSMAISEETGKMVLTESGDQVGFVVFGACIPR